MKREDHHKQQPDNELNQQQQELQAKHPHLRFVAKPSRQSYPQFTETDISDFEKSVKLHVAWRRSKGLPV